MEIASNVEDNSPEALARDAAKWRQLCSKVAECLDDSSNGFGSIWGGEDNLNVSVDYQCRGTSGMVLSIRWTADNEVREDLNAAVKPDRPLSQD